MRTILDALRELVAPQVLVEGPEDGPLELHESDPKSTCPVTRIVQAGRQVVALRFGPRSFRGGPEQPINEWLFPLFDTSRSKPPICRSCDYLLFYAPKDERRELFVFPCELKSSWTRGASAQLGNGLLLARYLLAVLEAHGDVNPWPPEVRFRGIVFSGTASRHGSLEAPGRRDWFRDDRTSLEMTIDRAGGRKYLQSFCA
jgi:hypothetical protein